MHGVCHLLALTPLRNSAGRTESAYLRYRDLSLVIRIRFFSQVDEGQESTLIEALYSAKFDTSSY